MSQRFAANTDVSAEKSRAEIERTLLRYGADQYMTGWSSVGEAMIGFRFKGRLVRLTLLLPDRKAKEFTHTAHHKYIRNPQDAEKAWEQGCRARWRALLLIVKAKLEAVEAGISTFEREFLADIVLPDGTNRTLGDYMVPQLEAAYEQGTTPRLLPGLKEPA